MSILDVTTTSKCPIIWDSMEVYGAYLIKPRGWYLKARWYQQVTRWKRKGVKP